MDDPTPHNSAKAGLSRPPRKQIVSGVNDAAALARTQLSWLREAKRLAQLYLQTSDRRHWLALVRHITGMAKRQNEGSGLS